MWCVYKYIKTGINTYALLSFFSFLTFFSFFAGESCRGDGSVDAVVRYEEKATIRIGKVHGLVV